VNSVNYPRASLTAYEAFLAGSTTTPLFAPSTVNGGTGNEYGTLEIVTNQRAWTVKIQSIGTSTFPALTLGNDRVKVFAEKVSGKGASWTATPTSITAASPLTLFNAGSGGQGRSVYKLYYLFTMDINDDIPLSGINEYITVNLLLTSP
jgi:hypothetical protein